MISGGPNTVVGNLVLFGAIEPKSGFDQAGMTGHAYLWDPLFFAWRAVVAISLPISARPAVEADRSLRNYTQRLNKPMMFTSVADIVVAPKRKGHDHGDYPGT